MWAADAIAKSDIPLGDKLLPKGKKITITKGVKYKYAIWDSAGIYDLPEEYVDEKTIKIYDNWLLVMINFLIN